MSNEKPKRHTTYAHVDSLSFTSQTVTMLCGSNNLVVSDGCIEYLTDWSKAPFMSITQIVGLTQAMIGAKSDGMRGRIIKPAGNVEHYARRMNLFKGKMWIVSRENAIEVSADGVRTLGGLYYPGTLVSLRLPVNLDSVVLASQVFEGGPDIPVVWNEKSGWVDLMGREVDVNQVAGSDDGLW